jgi:TldD protein
MDEDIAEFALEAATSLDITYADVRMETQKQNELTIKNGVLDVASYMVKEGLNIRIFTDHGVGFSSTSKLDKKSVEKTVKEAFKQSKACKRKIPPRLSIEKTTDAVWRVSEKEKISDVGIETKLDTLFEVDKKITSLGNLSARIFMYTDKQTEKFFLNSEGSRVKGYIPTVACLYYLTVKHNNQVEQSIQRFGYSGGWEGVLKFNMAEDAEKEVKALQTLMDTGKKSPEGTMDLVVGPVVMGIICHESCGHPTEADRILGREASQAGASFLNEELLGTRIGSDEVTVAEDPTIVHSFGYYGYDDEGVKTRRRLLFKNGLINEFLQNRESAAAMGTVSNGAARSSGFNREPIVRMANTFLVAGDYTKEELIEDVDHGIYMMSYTEWNIDDKRYNQKYIGRESYLIEKGEIQHMVKRPVLEITTPAFWKAVDAKGTDLDFRAGNCGKGDPIQEMEVLYGGPTTRLRGVYMR